MKTRIALVTGGARGLGLEFCRQLGDRGCTVILTARNEEQGIDAAKALKAEGYDVHFRQLNIEQEEEMAALAQACQQDFGELDLLVNNAGINSKSSGSEATFLKNFKLSELDPKEVLHMMHINAVAPILMVKHFLALMKKSRNPKVVSISSWLGSLAEKQNGGNYSYCASKAALNMLSRAMAFDVVRDGVTAIVVNPGWVRTDMGGSRAKLSPADSVKGILDVVDGISPRDAGKFYQWDGSEHPW
jgi:NAD(P)-dependent dehydrogenase (short-subunit alcohol dehydrogenase family)